MARAILAQIKTALLGLLCIMVLAAGGIALATHDADAATKKKSTSQTLKAKKAATAQKTTRRIAPVAALAAGSAAASPDNNGRYADLIIDASTGRILHETNADAIRHPASLTKMMTLYMIFAALENGKLRLQQQLPVSRNASIQSPSKLGLLPGDTISVENVILGLVTRSANDAAVVAAEAIGGSEDRFAAMMTNTARQLGMSSTVYANPNGLPDSRQVTSARDMARLGLALLKHYPQHYHYFSTASFIYKGQVIANHNHLMESYPGMDGFKTGFINASGFNLVTSAKQGNRRLIGVIFGGTSAASRDRQMAALLDAAFDGTAPSGRPRVDVAQAPQQVPQPAPTAVASNEVTSADSDIVQQVAARTAAMAARPAPEKPMQTAAATPVPAQSAMLPPTANDNSEEAQGFAQGFAQGDSNDEPAPVVQKVAAVTPAARKPAASKGLWGIQVGAYNDRASGQRATALVADSMPELLNKASSKVLAVSTASGTIYRARLVGISQEEARSACAKLENKGRPCLTLAPGSGGSAWLASAE